MIGWGDAAFASNQGPVSAGGSPVDDREYVIYAKVPNEDRWLQVAGRNPALAPRGDPTTRTDEGCREENG